MSKYGFSINERPLSPELVKKFIHYAELAAGPECLDAWFQEIEKHLIEFYKYLEIDK